MTFFSLLSSLTNVPSVVISLGGNSTQPQLGLNLNSTRLAPSNCVYACLWTLVNRNICLFYVNSAQTCSLAVCAQFRRDSLTVEMRSQLKGEILICLKSQKKLFWNLKVKAIKILSTLIFSKHALFDNVFGFIIIVINAYCQEMAIWNKTSRLSVGLVAYRRRINVGPATMRCEVILVHTLSKSISYWVVGQQLDGISYWFCSV